MGKTTAIRNKAYGPFECINELNGDGRAFLSLPFHEVAGCKVMLAVADNFANKITGGAVPAFSFPGLEISIWGTVQGFENMIKRECVHMLSGPMSITFDYADGWDTLLFRGRNMCGGSTVSSGTGSPTQANGFSITASVYVKPRSGFASPQREKIAGVG